MKNAGGNIKALVRALFQFARDARWTQVMLLREPNEQDFAVEFMPRMR